MNEDELEYASLCSPKKRSNEEYNRQENLKVL